MFGVIEGKKIRGLIASPASIEEKKLLDDLRNEALATKSIEEFLGII